MFQHFLQKKMGRKDKIQSIRIRNFGSQVKPKPWWKAQACLRWSEPMNFGALFVLCGGASPGQQGPLWPPPSCHSWALLRAGQAPFTYMTIWSSLIGHRNGNLFCTQRETEAYRGQIICPRNCQHSNPGRTTAILPLHTTSSLTAQSAGERAVLNISQSN